MMFGAQYSLRESSMASVMAWCSFFTLHRLSLAEFQSNW
jgi:hypothetical protein